MEKTAPVKIEFPPSAWFQHSFFALAGRFERIRLIYLLVLFILTAYPDVLLAQAKEPPVVLLHGLARSADSMKKLESQLKKDGFTTCNISYPSTSHSIKELVQIFVLPALAKCFTKESKRGISFVAHSLGGILVRELAKQKPAFKFYRVVMLSPPNQGSEVVDTLGDWWLFQWINGPAGSELGTEKESVPNALGPVPFELGVITGNQSINWILSAILPGIDDGKVTVQRARVAGMKDFLVLPASHPFIMKNDMVISEVKHFLKTGSFGVLPSE